MLTRLRLAIARWIAPFPYSVHTTAQCLDWANDLCGTGERRCRHGITESGWCAICDEEDPDE